MTIRLSWFWFANNYLAQCRKSSTGRSFNWEDLNGRRSARGAGDQAEIRRSFVVRRGSQPDHLEMRSQRGGNAVLEERQRTYVAEQATVIGRMVRLGLRREGRRLRQDGHTQQEEDNQ